MANTNNYTLLLQLEHVAGHDNAIGRVILVAHKAVELILEANTAGHYRKVMVSSNINEVCNLLKPAGRNTQGNKNTIPPHVVETDSSMAQPNTVTTIPNIYPVQYFPGTTIPLIQVIGSLVFVAIITTIGEFIYENRSPQGSYCNIPQPPGPSVLHEREFHREFLIPTSVFPQEFFLENIEKKSNLSKVAIFEDFIFYQNKIIQTFNLASSVGIKIVLFPACSKLAGIAVNMALNDFKQRFELLIGILTVAIALSVANLTGNLLKLSIKMSVLGVLAVLVLVHMVIIKVYKFGRNGVIWVFMFSRQKIIWVVEFIKKK